MTKDTATFGLCREDYDRLIAAGWRPNEIAVAMPNELHMALLKIDNAEETADQLEEREGDYR